MTIEEIKNDLIIEQNEDTIKNLKEQKNEFNESYMRGYICGMELVLEDIKKALRIFNKDGGENDGCNL